MQRILKILVNKFLSAIPVSASGGRERKGVSRAWHSMPQEKDLRENKKSVFWLTL
jgi:hypothetical protein